MKNNNSFSIDSFVNNKELNIMKAVLPLLPPQPQKFLAIYIAMNELSSIFSLMNAIGNGNLACNKTTDTEIDFSKIFEAIKKFLDPSEVEMYENYMNIMNVMNTMNMFNDMSDGDFNMDSLKSMLTPEQSAIFDSFSNT